MKNVILQKNYLTMSNQNAWEYYQKIAVFIELK